MKWKKQVKSSRLKCPKGWENRAIITTIRGHKDCPVSAKLMAKLITAQVKLLESVEKNIVKENAQKQKTEWCLTEAAVIGQDASFTLMGYPQDWYRSQLKAAKTARAKGANKA